MRIKWPSNEQVLYLANVLADRLWFKQNPKDLRSILVVRWDEIGDMAASAHVFAAIKRQFPQAQVTLLCKPFVASLVQHDPNIDHIITDIELFNQSYDAVLEMRGSWKTFWKSFRYGVKFRSSRATVRLKHKGHQLHETLTNSETLKLLIGDVSMPIAPLYVSQEDKETVAQFLSKNQIQKFAILHAGARRVLRQWPKDRFAWAANYLKETYQLDIVFAGSSEDNADIQAIQADLNFATYAFTDGYSLTAFAALCQKAKIYLGNESGPLQIASLMELPVIGLFGPGVPAIFYPLSAHSVVCHPILDCNPCDQIHCVHPDNPCIQRISTDMVRGAINEILH